MNSTNPIISRIDSLSYITFEPTFTFFDNTTIINYKKTGSRFFEILCKAPNGYPYNPNEPDGENYSTQIDSQFIWLDEPHTGRNILNLKGVDYDVKFNFEQKKNIFKWKSDDEIFDNIKSHDISALLKNPTKKITFVIKNPLVRFLSGVVQILTTYISDNLKDIEERERLKRYTGLTDDDIKYVWRRADAFFSEDFHMKLSLKHDSMEGIDKFVTICCFLLENRFDLILQDIHTENYLDIFKTLIDGIENENYQIIDIDECTTKKAYGLFDTFSDTINYSDYYDILSVKNQTNSHIYEFLFDVYKKDAKKLEAIPHLLKREYLYYKILKSSKHFVSLK
jgi:hypothetical protein